MTPGNNGASTPEDDDPFGYLYADGQARGAQPPTGGYGYPNAVNRMRAVGERQYGGQQAQQPQPPQAPTAQYGQAPQQQGYGQPNAHYQAPEAYPGGRSTNRQQSHDGGGRGGGPNTRGLLIGAIAVVAAVVIGISIAMLGGDDDSSAQDNPSASASLSAEESTEPSASASDEAEEEVELPATDAQVLSLDGGATLSSDISGAKANGGVYVTGFNAVGASVTWNVEDVPEEGQYTLYVGYGVPGKDADATLTVNGTVQTRPLNMKNFGNTPEGDYEKGWQSTYAFIELTKGTNIIKISCEQGNSCDVNLDQLWLEAGWNE